MDNNTKTSFIIPHKGREEFLLQTVESILSQDIDKDSYEILIITQNSELVLLTSIIAGNNNIKVFTQPEGITISALRNYGVKQCASEFLAFLDADVALSQNWLTCMLAMVNEKEQRILVSAAQINGNNAPPLERIRTALSNAELDCNVNFLPGRNLFISRKHFELVNGFPEHLITCEDYYFTDQVHKHGDLYYTSKATYVHLGEDKQYKEMYKKEIWRGQSNLQSIKGRKIPLREIPSFILPISLMIFLSSIIISLFIGNTLFAFISLILLVLPFSFYSMRLQQLTKNDVSFKYILQFYLVYFPARAIGTIGGLFKSFSNTNSK